MRGMGLPPQDAGSAMGVDPNALWGHPGCRCRPAGLRRPRACRIRGRPHPASAGCPVRSARPPRPRSKDVGAPGHAICQRRGSGRSRRRGSGPNAEGRRAGRRPIEPVKGLAATDAYTAAVRYAFNHSASLKFFSLHEDFGSVCDRDVHVHIGGVQADRRDARGCGLRRRHARA